MYNTRIDTYGCGCAHNCKYCYAKSLLHFRGLWDENKPRTASLRKIENAVKKLPAGSIVRLGGMTDCFQPMEAQAKVTYETLKMLGEYRIRYLIVTKSDLVARPEYLAAMDRDLAHIQISVTTLNDGIAKGYESASPPSQRIKALYELQENGFDAALRLSPIIDGYMDYKVLNKLTVQKCIVEFLRVNTWIKRWFPELDFSGHTLRHGNYLHLPLETKQEILSKIGFGNVSVCEDVSGHYAYWRDHFNPNKADCCNLRPAA